MEIVSYYLIEAMGSVEQADRMRRDAKVQCRSAVFLPAEEMGA